jgi:hypothetical protein
MISFAQYRRESLNISFSARLFARSSSSATRTRASVPPFGEEGNLEFKSPKHSRLCDFDWRALKGAYHLQEKSGLVFVVRDACCSDRLQSRFVMVLLETNVDDAVRPNCSRPPPVAAVWDESLALTIKVEIVKACHRSASESSKSQQRQPYDFQMVQLHC